ncbi:MAG: TraB/GumN family protein [Polyangiales bacterium]
MIRILVIVAALIACTPKPPSCPALPVVTQGPAFLWKVHKDAGPTLWLYGTVHDVALAGVPAAALAALDGAKVFASELGDAEADPETVRDLTRYKSGLGIDQTLPDDDWYALRDALLGTIKEESLRRVRPWYALILLNNKVSPNKPVAMDTDLAKHARSKKLPVEALETWAEQMTALDKVVTVKDLSDAIHARDAMHCEVDRLGVAYRTGDLDLMAALFVVPRTADALLWTRNRAWQPKLEAYLAAQGAFVAVGLGHMLGENGLPALLARAGYIVERVP